jgi:hypothetical protein
MNEPRKKGKSRLRNDVLLIAALLLLSAVGIVYLFVFRPGGDTVKVTVDGELYGTYSLSEPRTEEIRTGDDGGQINRLIIRDGKAHMEYATCPDGICVSHRPIFRNGESIVCLPNRVVVTVVTENASDVPDIVA